MSTAVERWLTWAMQLPTVERAALLGITLEDPQYVEIADFVHGEIDGVKVSGSRPLWAEVSYSTPYERCEYPAGMAITRTELRLAQR